MSANSVGTNPSSACSKLFTINASNDSGSLEQIAGPRRYSSSGDHVCDPSIKSHTREGGRKRFR